LAVAQIGFHLPLISLPLRDVCHDGEEGARVRGFPHEAARDRRGTLLLLLLLLRGFTAPFFFLLLACASDYQQPEHQHGH
jgi:hypothetical protein